MNNLNFDTCSVRMVKLKEQNSIFTGLWMTFWWLFEAVPEKSIFYFANIHKGFKTLISCCFQHLEELQEFRHARMHILFLSGRFPPVRLGYVTGVNWPRRCVTRRRLGTSQTEKAWENAVQGLGNAVRTWYNISNAASSYCMSCWSWKSLGNRPWTIQLQLAESEWGPHLQ